MRAWALGVAMVLLVELRSAENNTWARQIRVRELGLGDRTQRDVPAVALDRPDAARPKATACCRCIFSSA